MSNRIELLKKGKRVSVLIGGMIQRLESGSIENNDAVFSDDIDATFKSVKNRVPDLDFDDIRTIDDTATVEDSAAIDYTASIDDTVSYVAVFTKQIRDTFAITDAAQAEAYRQVEIVARRVLTGDASTTDKAFLKARDVDAKTLNPLTGKPVGDVEEAAKVIVMTAEVWYSVLSTTEVARKQAVAKIRAMDPADVPRDLNAWLTENFKWLPENLS